MHLSISFWAHPEKSNVRVLVFGTGAVGGLIGARLALTGHEVVFLARPRVVDALRRNGLTLIDDQQVAQVPNVIASSDFSEAVKTGHPDLILLCVKAYDCADAAALIKDTLPEPIPVLSMLNGINNEQTLAQALGSGNVIAGTLTTAVEMPELAVVRVARKRGVGIAGTHPMTAEIVGRFKQARFHCEHYPNPGRMKWSKLMTNIVANTTSAITGFNPGEVFAHPGLARMEMDALRETVWVMRKIGFGPQNLPGVSVSLLGRAVFLPAIVTRHLLGRIVAGGRGSKKPSLHHDIGRGKSEVDWLNGAVVRYGEQFGVPTPVNRALYETMKELVEDQSLHQTFLGHPERLISKAYPGNGGDAG